MREYEMPMICSPRATAFFRYGAPFAQAGEPDISVEANLESLSPRAAALPALQGRAYGKAQAKSIPGPASSELCQRPSFPCGNDCNWNLTQGKCCRFVADFRRSWPDSTARNRSLSPNLRPTSGV